METINNIATAARNSVFGDNSQTAKPDTEPPSVGVPGKGTPDAPFDRGNEPEQAQSDGRPAETKAETLVTPPTPASKIDNPDPAVPSEMKSAVSANDAAKSVNPTATSTTTASGAGSETDSKVKPSKATQPYSHSALFGLGTKENGTKGDVHPPKDSGNLSGTCEEAGKGLTKQAAMEEKGANEDDTGGYVGLKKAAMEEEERKKKEEENQESGGDSNVVSEWKSLAAKDAEDRNPRSLDHKSSLGRDISPGEMPDGTHRRSIAEGAWSGGGSSNTTSNNAHPHHLRRAFTGGNIGSNGGSADSKTGGGFRDRLKDRFRSKK